jgi:hypothetical protein
MKTHAYTSLFILITATFLTTGCKKDKEQELADSKIAFYANGQRQDWVSKKDINFYFWSLLSDPGKEKPTPILIVQSHGFELKINTQTSEPVSTLTYSTKFVYTGKKPDLIIRYTDKEGNNYAPSFSDTDITITILENSRNKVLGNFSGKLVCTGKPNIEITEGYFEVYNYEMK